MSDYIATGDFVSGDFFRLLNDKIHSILTEDRILQNVLHYFANT